MVNSKDDKSKSLDVLKKYITNLSPKTKVKLLLVVVSVLILVVVYYNFVVSESQVGQDKVDSVTNNSYYVSSIDYCDALEQKLCRVLSNIDGLGKVEVMVTLSSSLELVYASSLEDHNSSIFDKEDNGNVFSPIIIDNNGKEEPLIVKEVLPKVKGVLVVCENLDSVNKKLDIIYAVQSLLDINISNIQVLSNN